MKLYRFQCQQKGRCMYVPQLIKSGVWTLMSLGVIYTITSCSGTETRWDVAMTFFFYFVIRWQNWGAFPVTTIAHMTLWQHTISCWNQPSVKLNYLGRYHVCIISYFCANHVSHFVQHQSYWWDLIV